MKHVFVYLLILSTITSCSEKKVTYKSFTEYPTPTETSLWLEYTKEATIFKIWSPIAEKVQLHLYKEGNGGTPLETETLKQEEKGIWTLRIDRDLHGTYYTYQTMVDGKWLEETPGIYAKATGVNGKRAMVLDFETTNPDGWDQDKGTALTYPNEAIIYELHIRDMTIHPQSGSSKPGKYLGLVEEGTKGPDSVATGIDHLKELGITHVHLLPTYDHYSIDETKLDTPQFNWGYDPQNYNVPEGSFSSDPYKAEVRIKEFKQMVKAFHDNGIGVILDVVYNHTGRTENSNFNLEVPGYYYRQWEDGKPSDASACGNETASDRAMMQKYITESVAYWAKEYHLDGFRFDLMGIHDTETMNKVAKTVKTINPNIFVYGEGWTAGDSPLPEERRALKKNTLAMPQISAFSDDLRDGLKGSVFKEESIGFVSGAKNASASVKMGIVGSIKHPQIDYTKVNYSKAPWANEPWQSVSYVSCHDNHTVFDKLKISRKDATKDELIAMQKLSNAIVMTSQGVAFIHAGAEMLRTKNGEHNSYNLPDSINQIDWSWKNTHADVVTYYKNLITLRKTHPAFRMTKADDVRENLEFKEDKNGLISYQIKNNANGDSWKNILVVYNSNPKAIAYQLNETWQVAVLGGNFDFEETKNVKSKINIPPISLMVLFQE
ncbi:type I pullulanase [Aquimarina sp. BL5]|uniref:type I pullulanase n=1 Tax=Aquimarina sp. BL5 TaxID=1714860 RepID=UPI000E4EF4BD|nr:type I pullulanase [Aquimarina sp. BL5]AXT49568.1 type I pullulanase [Aquimarina sp. BL5]RKM91342.1 type I pullulanase [Aquimarina sp. BL5]